MVEPFRGKDYKLSVVLLSFFYYYYFYDNLVKRLHSSGTFFFLSETLTRGRNNITAIMLMFKYQLKHSICYKRKYITVNLGTEGDEGRG